MNSVFYKPTIKAPLWSIKQFFVSLKWAHQRAHKGYCDKDVWNIDTWFLNIAPDMLEALKSEKHGFPCVLIRDYYEEHKEQLQMTFDEFRSWPSDEQSEEYQKRQAIHNECAKRWESILDSMIFLLREANEDTCSKLNPYQDAYDKAWKEFTRKYGRFGKALLTDDEKRQAKENKRTRIYLPSDLPEYQRTMELYSEEYDKIADYQEKCKEEAFLLFTKWFRHLWD